MNRPTPEPKEVSPGKRPVSFGLIAMARIYQRTLSRFLGNNCRFTPTCSVYFIEAVTRKGALRGTAKGLWRIFRCNPFCKGGYDPVEGIED